MKGGKKVKEKDKAIAQLDSDKVLVGGIKCP